MRCRLFRRGKPASQWWAVAWLLLALGGPVGCFTYAVLHPDELRQLVGPPERECRCP